MSVPHPTGMAARSSTSSGNALWRFFFAEMAPDTLCMLRVLIGAYLVVSLLLLTPTLLRYVPDGGPVPFDLVRREINGNTFTILTLVHGVFGMLLVHFVAIVAAICMTIGRWTRTASVVLYVLYVSYMNAILNVWDGGDGLTTNILFLLAVAGLAGHTSVAYAMDARRKRRNGKRVSAMIPAWSLRLLQLQLCMMYFFSGWYKTQFIEWQNGEALHYVFQQLAFLTFPMHGLSHWPIMVVLLTQGIMFLEIAAPFLLWIRPLKGPVLGALFLFHLGIRLTIHVFAFGIVLPLFIVFIEPQTVRRWARRCHFSIDHAS